MFGLQDGWATSSYDESLFRTQDGGESWSKVTPPGQSILGDAYFLNSLMAWYIEQQSDQNNVVKGLLHATSDGGKSWQTFQLPFTGGPLQFMDANNGVVTTDMGAAAGNLYFRIYRTSDGGQTWNLMHIKNPYGFSETLPPSMPEGTIHVTSGDSFEFQTPSIIWFGGGGIAASKYADLYASRDAGQTWKHFQLPLPEQKPDSGFPVVIDLPTFFTPLDGIFAARYEGQDSQPDNSTSQYLATYITHDGGLTWSVNPQPLVGIDYWERVDFISMSDAFVSCGDNLCTTHDGGMTWQKNATNLHFYSGQDRLLAALDFVDAQTGWAIIDLQNGSTQLYKTTDGGKTWNMIPASLN